MCVSFAYMLLLNLSEKQRFSIALSELNETEITKVYKPLILNSYPIKEWNQERLYDW